MHISRGGFVTTAHTGKFGELGWCVGKPAGQLCPLPAAGKWLPGFSAVGALTPQRASLWAAALGGESSQAPAAPQGFPPQLQEGLGRAGELKALRSCPWEGLGALPRARVSTTLRTSPEEDFHHRCGAESCYSSPHLGVYSGNTRTHRLALLLHHRLWYPLVQAGLHLGSSMTKFLSHSLQTALFWGTRPTSNSSPGRQGRIWLPAHQPSSWACLPHPPPSMVWHSNLTSASNLCPDTERVLSHF